MTSRPKLKIDSKGWWRLPQELRFLLAGAYNTAFGYLVFTVLYYGFGTTIGYLGVAVLCQAVALTSAFIVHRRLVFRSTVAWPASFLRFNLSQLMAILCGMLGLYALVHFAHLNPLLAQAIVILVSVVITYTLHRYFSFRVRPSSA
jgi:putative flippase GtrA